ncbi:GntR family transcriptional regulator [Phosphitispora fastidiosa]|uniref:GntR family transcriptional regulator n=1 Tax=Phosphitispora fastidiosa TaxID=2837202 RepID=UPI001E37E63C|nr:GntR family transcriptional regulator [Phosphitispora fastidiosa]MBU7006611.1 DNA-binding GntR family transcriptional regulator [Phosphitispora fastidiosa]
MSRKPGIARYEIIAVDLAQAISEGIYSEGSSLRGRSLLAGKYQVSPETIRKAISLLEGCDIVRSIPSKGVIVNSREKAARYVEGENLGSVVSEIEAKLGQLFREKQQLEEEIENTIKTLLVLASLQNKDLHS